jgi:hypothetical protein
LRLLLCLWESSVNLLGEVLVGLDDLARHGGGGVWWRRCCVINRCLVVLMLFMAWRVDVRFVATAEWRCGVVWWMRLVV